jgi:broad specificity phosphatase PhoE
MITFYLIRHGQKEGHSGDPKLDNVGKIKAKATAKFLKYKHIKQIYASPLSRTMETASLIANELGLEVKIDQRLYERLNWGDRKGETYDNFWKEWQKTDLDRDYKPSHGYSSRESGQRLESVLQDITRDSRGNGNFLIVTSGGIIGDLLKNIFPEKILPLKTNETSGAKYIEILECSITVIRKDEGYILEKSGDLSHLSPTLI